ncbi:hypothetical protein DAPPUDRAFT_99586 [Daphnia pulex]|uniref:Uncharacterized protein n=1 Tax=Daphnia pulex TaxID=6669 RepID=E9G7C5_DAPPU|nr:hypothetical protein DAPPUDRAFT_99586 [Daphnia pulex]|eukprot:EFX84443.1 hypothetical protein DAPPUDRAFT_99586 [Daphnia pulex]
MAAMAVTKTIVLNVEHVVEVCLASNEVFLQYKLCREPKELNTNEDEGYDYSGTYYEGGTTFVHEDGQGAKTLGVKYNRAEVPWLGNRVIIMTRIATAKCLSRSLENPKEEEDFQEYLTLTKLGIDDETAHHIKRSVTQISKELLQLFKYMTWIEKERKGTDDIPKYLGRILHFKDVAVDALFQEEETARINEPIISPVIPRELTAEEGAILDVPELNEKDSPEN